MSYSAIISILFFSVCIVSMVTGILVIQNHRGPANRCFFVMIISLIFWSVGLGLANIAVDAATCEVWRRFSAIGWGTFYSITLHFLLILTERRTLLKKGWFYILLYFPAAVSVVAFAVPSGLNPVPYQLVQTEFGWVNVASFNIWDWFFYAYYIGYLILGLILVYRWGKKSHEDKIKKQSRAIFLSFIAALIIASIIDVLLGNYMAKLPQMAPIIVLIPLMTIYYIIKEYSFMGTESIGRKQSYTRFIVCIILFTFFAFLQASLSIGGSISAKNQMGSSLLGILTQLQMMISIYLVLNEEKSGYIAVLLLNTGSTLASINSMIRSRSTEALPGLMSFLGVIFITILISTYKKRNDEKVRLEKLLNQISNLFLTTNESNIDDKLVESMALCGNHFELEFIYISFLAKEKTSYKDYEWYTSDTEIKDSVCIREKLRELISVINIDKLVVEGSLFVVDSDISEEYKPIRNLLEGIDVKSLVIKPLKEKNETIGVLFLSSNKKTFKWGEQQWQTTNLLTHLVTDIWVKLEAERELYYHANYDMLTGLPNRITFLRRLSQEINKKEQVGKLIGVIFIDIDGFKAVNDSVGHESGDSILLKVGSTLRDYIRQADFLARFGGDEFLIMVPQMDTVDGIRSVAERLTNAFKKTFTVKEHEFHMSASIGIAVYPYDGTDSATLIKNADLAMYKSKEHGKNRYTFCTEEMKMETNRKIKLAEDLHRALEQQELRLHYQPQVCAVSNKISGMEALLRWFHPKFGTISPGLFIPLAEQNGLIGRIGDWVLMEACLQCRTYHLMGFPHIRVAVNVSIVQLRNHDFACRVREILEETQLEARYLELEITENIAVGESDYLIAILYSLKELGVSIAIDDFGTEYSSLSRLCIMPIDRIKLDMQFTQAIGRSEKENQIILGIIDLAHTLGLEIIAEGVESEIQHDFLTKSSINEIQGFYCYKPLPPEELESILGQETISTVK